MISYRCMCSLCPLEVRSPPASRCQGTLLGYTVAVCSSPQNLLFLSSISLAGLALNIPFIHWWSAQQRSGECRWWLCSGRRVVALTFDDPWLKVRRSVVGGDQQTHTRTYIHYTSLRKIILPVRSLHSCKGDVVIVVAGFANDCEIRWKCASDWSVWALGRN